MRHDATPARAVPSPCTGLCRIDACTGWCEGCRRSLDEIASWSSLTEDQRRAVWLQLGGRRKPPPDPATSPA